MNYGLSYPVLQGSNNGHYGKQLLDLASCACRGIMLAVVLTPGRLKLAFSAKNHQDLSQHFRYTGQASAKTTLHAQQSLLSFMHTMQSCDVMLGATAARQSVVTVQVVPKGTNGGISMLGNLFGFAGGLCMGLTFWLSAFLTSNKMATLPFVPCILIAVFGAMFGNFFDSLLGATLQYSGYNKSKGVVVTAPGSNVQHICGYAALSNSQVNLISSVVTSVASSCVARAIL